MVTLFGNFSEYIFVLMAVSFLCTLYYCCIFPGSLSLGMIAAMRSEIKHQLLSLLLIPSGLYLFGNFLPAYFSSVAGGWQSFSDMLHALLCFINCTKVAAVSYIGLCIMMFFFRNSIIVQKLVSN